MKTLDERFWPRVDRRGDDECWPWLGAPNEHGYGVIHHGGKMFKAHRVSFMLANGRDPVGDVLHSCDNGAQGCVNPAHLSEGTHQQNCKEARDRGRAMKKMTVESRRQLLERRRCGASYTELVEEFGISRASVGWHLDQAGLVKRRPRTQPQTLGAS